VEIRWYEFPVHAAVYGASGGPWAGEGPSNLGRAGVCCCIFNNLDWFDCWFPCAPFNG
jgi:hypothetical protein